MHFIPNEVYHIYNRGNNRQKIFYSDANYCFFLRKLSVHILTVADILAYCLMPNHYHIVVHANESSCEMKDLKREIQELSYQIGKMTSSYSQAINKQNGTTGTIFQQKTKAKPLLQGNADNKYLVTAINYCHQNPKTAGLVQRMEDWPYSSFNEYCDDKIKGICNKDLFVELTGWNLNNFYRDSYGVIRQ